MNFKLACVVSTYEEILEDEEEHLDWIDTQLSVIGDIGIERYLQSQLSA